MKRLLLLFLIVSSIGCAGQPQKGIDIISPISQIPPSTVEEGTLANERLASDATSALSSVLSKSLSDQDVLKFVIQSPVGSTGWAAWRELWVIKDSESSFIMTFSEDGEGGAFFEITKR